MEYDSSGKRFVAAETFQPRFLRPNPDRYLAQLKALSDGIIEIADTWIATSPPTGVLPVPTRRIDPQVLRELLNAVRHKRAIHIEYQSMSREHPEPLWRWISPHAFGFDGLRWHARAFCHRTSRFLDFLLGRCLSAAGTEAAGAQAADDWEWQEIFDVVLEPNPELTEGQRRAIELDYGMTGGRVSVPVRYALLYYFNKRLRMDVGAILDSPQERPVVIANQEEFGAALVKATGQGAVLKNGDDPPRLP